MENDVFVRYKVNEIKEGLLKELEPELAHTLLALTSFMDKDGVCYPSQSHLAFLLGVSRTTVNQRLQRLKKVTWKGEPILTTEKRKVKGKWENNVYKISHSSGFAIF